MAENNDIARGNDARAVLDNEAFISAVKEVRKSYMDAILASKPEDREARERGFFCVRGLDNVLTRLAVYIDSGEIKRKEIENSDMKRARPPRRLPAFLQNIQGEQ